MHNRFFGALVALFVLAFPLTAGAQEIRFQERTSFEQFGLNLNVSMFNPATAQCGVPGQNGEPKYIFWEHGKKDVPQGIILWCSVSKQHYPAEKFAMLVVELRSGSTVQDARNFAMLYTSSAYNPMAGTNFIIRMPDTAACFSSAIFVAAEDKDVEMHACPFTANGGDRLMIDVPLTTKDGRRVVAIIYNYDRFFPISRENLLKQVRLIMGGGRVS
jgi:hypothetical protein